MGREKDEALLAALYASVTHDDAFTTMLELLAGHFSCRSAVIVYVDPRRPEADIAVGFGTISGDVITRYKRDYAAIDPAPAAMARMPIGRAATTEMLFGADPEAHHRFLHEFFYPLGLAETIGGPIVNIDGRFGLIGINRPPDRPPFDAADIAALERLMPHLTQAIELRRAFFEIRTESSLLKSAIDTSAAGILVVAPNGRVVTANLVARAILDRRDGLTVDRAGRLTSAQPATNQALAEAFSRLGAGDDAVLLHVPRRNGSHGYSLRCSRGGNGERGTVDGFVIAIHDPGQEVPDLPRILGDTFRLTPSGAALVAALVEGHDLRSYAARAGISTNTAKFHLQAAFAATGTRRQADLVRRATALVRDIGRPGDGQG